MLLLLSKNHVIFRIQVFYLGYFTAQGIKRLLSRLMNDDLFLMFSLERCRVQYCMDTLLAGFFKT